MSHGMCIVGVFRVIPLLPIPIHEYVFIGQPTLQYIPSDYGGNYDFFRVLNMEIVGKITLLIIQDVKGVGVHKNVVQGKRSH